MTHPADPAPAGPVSALISVHDLMPATMPAVRRILTLLEQAGRAPVTLLVVPGSGWARHGIRELKALQRSGYRLAGHGWLHRVPRFGGLYHRLHGLLLSRGVAEHLALDADGIFALIDRCYAWFGDQGLDRPDLYVPPAWAMGSISSERLASACPFALYETFNGVLDVRNRRRHRIPMLGYEADQSLRVPVLRAWNALNRRLGRRARLLRIGIHPWDGDLGLRKDLIADIERYDHAIDYAALGDG